MCGRFTQTQSADAIADAFDLSSVPPLEPRYNIAPSQAVIAIVKTPEPSERQLKLLQWGLIPRWAKDPAIGNKLINARAETVDEKPSFRDAFRKRRCLIVADGFYEWQRQENHKQPYYFYLRDCSNSDSVTRRPFAFAGLWETWQESNGDAISEAMAKPIASCTILTTHANDLLRPVHNRMPVILKPEDYETWLNPHQTSEELKHLLQPYPSDAMDAYPVSTMVNRPKHDSPDCVQPLEAV